MSDIRIGDMVKWRGDGSYLVIKIWPNGDIDIKAISPAEDDTEPIYMYRVISDPTELEIIPSKTEDGIWIRGASAVTDGI